MNRGYPVRTGLLVALTAALAQVAGAATVTRPGAPVEASSPGAVESYHLEVDLRELERGGERIELALPGGVIVHATRRAVEARGAHDFAWRGRVEPHGGDVLLTVHGGRVAGLVYLADAVWEISPAAGGGHRLERLDHDRFPECAAPVPDGAIERPPAAVRMRGAGAPVLVDVLVVYTPQARDGAGGQTAIETTAQAAVDIGNTAFAESDVDVRFRLVGAALAAHDDSGNSSTDLSWVRNDPATAALRDALGADMVSLVVENGAGVCGRGYLGPAPTSVYQVTARGCAVGNLTWAHEHGHNLGMQHDPANGNTPGGAWRTWAFGHFVSTSPPLPGGNFRTVLSYSTECPFGCARVPRFSNPAIRYNDGPTGTDDGRCDPATYLPGDPNAWACRDNHRVANESGPIVATYRDPPPLFLDGFETGDTAAWSSSIP